MSGTTTPITTRLVQVTPQIAEAWLAKNVLNRSVREFDVARYAADMAAGLWQFTGEAIKFCIDGNLLDGQHRLHGVRRSGATVPMLVVENLPAPAQHVMDSGVKRTAGDALGLSGVKNAALTAAAAKFAICWENNMLFTAATRVPVSTSQIEQWLSAHPEFDASVGAMSGRKAKIACPPSVLVVAHWMFARLDADMAEYFFTNLARLSGLEDGDPILALHHRITDIATHRRRTSQRDHLAFLITTWNKWIDGDRLTRLTRPAGGKWTADNFPVAHG